MKCNIYLRPGQLQVPVSHLKYEDQYIYKTWPITDAPFSIVNTLFATQNMKPIIYWQLVSTLVVTKTCLRT